MNCPVCAREGREGVLEVKSTRKDFGSAKVRRRRVCANNPRHRMDTVEHPLHVPLSTIRVRRPNGEMHAFNKQHLRDDVQRGVLKRLTRVEVADVVEEVCAELQEELVERDAPDTDNPDTERTIDDLEIRSHVVARLRRIEKRDAHVLYVLSFRGRVDSRPVSGFHTAEDFLRWLYGEYPDLGRPFPRHPPRAEERWYPPRGFSPEPKRVLKRDGTYRDFGRDQFRDSIHKALVGKEQSSRVARLVTERVLWAMAGQDVVLSSQLASEVMHCLRRVDDIAYLRYASVAKRFRSVREFADEANGLLECPSPYLTFDKGLLTLSPPEA